MAESSSTDVNQPERRDEPPSKRTELRRGAIRADYRAQSVREILEAGMLRHLSVSLGEHPAVIPTVYGLIGDQLYLHARTLRRDTRTEPRRDPPDPRARPADR
jgi:hypothetical protein